jgi:hypothetical protein
MDLVKGFVDQSFKRCTMDWWAEVAAGLPECGLASIFVAGVSLRGAKKVEGRRGTRLRRRLGVGSPELAERWR